MDGRYTGGTMPLSRRRFLGLFAGAMLAPKELLVVAEPEILPMGLATAPPGMDFYRVGGQTLFPVYDRNGGLLGVQYYNVSSNTGTIGALSREKFPGRLTVPK